MRDRFICKYETSMFHKYKDMTITIIASLFWYARRAVDYRNQI